MKIPHTQLQSLQELDEWMQKDSKDCLFTWLDAVWMRTSRSVMKRHSWGVVQYMLREGYIFTEREYTHLLDNQTD